MCIAITIKVDENKEEKIGKGVLLEFLINQNEYIR